ncbi:hypothetical protein QKW52_05960 [Bacillus sonorensis]|nr:hypothetical protein [Bacillus sonorensis]
MYEAVINNLSFNILEIGEWLMILLYISIVFAEALGDLKRKKKKEHKNGSLYHGSLVFHTMTLPLTTSV